MRKPSLAAGWAVAVLLCLFWPSSPASGGGFELFHQSSKAMAMGGTGVASAEDPSVLFYNPGGLALLGDKPIVAVGVAGLNLNQSSYQGLPPGVGAGTNGEQDDVQQYAPHAYVALPVGAARLGLGVYSPFLAQTDWSQPDSFPGRYLTTAFRLRTLDLTAAIAFELGGGLAFGAGAVYRTSDLRHDNRLPSFNPSSGQVVDVASLRLDATLDSGVGWTTGIQQQVGEALSWGIAYRSPIEIDYSGEARMEQIPTGNTSLDALIAATFPLDQDLSFRSRIEFPATAAAGIAFALTEGTTVAIDTTWTDWTTFDTLDFVLPNNPEFDSSMPQAFVESTAYRLGTRIDVGGGAVLRFGASFDESPQGETALGPLLPDGDETSYSVGFSMDWLDVAFVWSATDTRTTLVNNDEFNGTYTSNSWALGITITE